VPTTMRKIKWVGYFLEFAKDAGRWGVASVVAASFFFGIAVWDHLHDKSVPSFWFLAFSLPLFWAGAFAAWIKKHRRVEELQDAKEYPKPFLQYIEERNINSDRSEFFVQVEGDKNAFDVEISSEPVVGERHKRLAMQWEVPKGPVGKTSVPVRAFCVQYERDIPHLAGGIISPGQIHTFFERKKDFPNELEVTMTFKDVDGRKCPPKRFIINSYRDTRGNIRIGISPVENKAASRT
jgi:hypothetical protein